MRSPPPPPPAPSWLPGRPILSQPPPPGQGWGRVAGPCSLPPHRTYCSFPVMWWSQVSHLPRRPPLSFESDPQGLPGPQLESCCHRMKGMEVRWQNLEAPPPPQPQTISWPGIFSQLLCSWEKPAPQTQPWSGHIAPALWPRGLLGARTKLVSSFNTFRSQGG